jgi:hypothetical protein
MFPGPRCRCLSVAIALSVLAVTVGPAPATAAGPPVIGSTWASAIFSSTARLSAQVNPNGIFTTYHFDYITQAAYDANVGAAKEPFAGASRIPVASEANIGSGIGLVTVTQLLSGLQAGTAYRYRLVAKNSATTTGPALAFITQSTGGGPTLADGRGWEMVSPADKNGGQVEPPGAIAGGGVLQAAADGQSVTYGSAASFAQGAQGAAPASQYISTRGAGGWSAQNITAPIFSGSYDAEDQGVPYRLFSGDLARGLLLNGDHCRGEGEDCAVANPPLAGTDAPAGYQNYYLRQGGSYTALLGSANAGFLDLDPADFDLRLAGASPDLGHAVLSSCAGLTSTATEVPLGEGCDATKPNLYEYSAGSGLTAVNLLPAQSTTNPGAALAAPAAAISTDGTRVYWTDTASGDLYLRTAGQTRLVADEATFQTASSDGSIAFYTKPDGHLYRYEAAGAGSSTDLTPSGGVAGVLGASADGTYLYYQDATALELWHAGSSTTVAPGADAAGPGDYPPSTGTTRVLANGTRLLFVSAAQLSEYDNTDLNTATPDSEVYLYDVGGAGTLTCVSCNPTLGRPIGSSSIPGSIANGTATGSAGSYKPRALSASGARVFFDSKDALVLTDTDNAADAYEWEAEGEGSCAKAGGCVSLISSGRSASGASFIDASADGQDAFFLTDGSLVTGDPGALDLYDARIGGGFPEPAPPIICEGDACQGLPSAPADPTLTTLLTGPGNPAVHYPKTKKTGCKAGTVKRGGKCVKKAQHKNKKSSHKRRSVR